MWGLSQEKRQETLALSGRASSAGLVFPLGLSPLVLQAGLEATDLLSRGASMSLGLFLTFRAGLSTFGSKVTREYVYTLWC